jgi:hypothetical protein
MKHLSVFEVNQLVEGVRANSNDGERAHSMEDDLREWVLEAIANGAPNAVELAKAALETSAIDFPRWCA